MPDPNAELIQMLLARLERVPADSIWAHRASGLRGALLDALEPGQIGDAAAFDRLAKHAFRVLERAAAEKTRASLGLRTPAQTRR